jgi:hypothetical protein
LAATVYLLWFVREQEEEGDIELLIGVYRTKQDATDAIERLRDKPGFRDFPQGFESCEYELNKDHWIEGFVKPIED